MTLIAILAASSGTSVHSAIARTNRGDWRGMNADAAAVLRKLPGLARLTTMPMATLSIVEKTYGTEWVKGWVRSI